MQDQVICEQVTIDGDLTYLVQYTADESSERASCLAYLRDCGHDVTVTPHAVVGPGDEPAVSWGDLSDIIAPRDS